MRAVLHLISLFSIMNIHFIKTCYFQDIKLSLFIAYNTSV